jgi:hypothetical protein
MTQRRKGERSSQNQGLTEETLLDGELERAALEKLTRLGVQRDELLSLVLHIPDSSNEVQPLVAGMDERTVRALPDRMIDLANNIEKVNASPALDPDRLHRVPSKHPEILPTPLYSAERRGSPKLTASYFRTIHIGLRVYADYLRARLDFYHPTKSRRTPEQVKRGFRNCFRHRTWLTLNLLTLVRHSTGKACRKEIATLLDAAYRASGRPQTIDVDYLKGLEKNNRYLALIVSEGHRQSND